MDSSQACVVEATTKFTQRWKLGVARVVSKPVQGTVPVRILNVSSDAVTFFKGTNVGLFCPIDKVCEKHAEEVNECSTNQPVSSVDMDTSRLFDLEDANSEHQTPDVFFLRPHDLGRSHTIRHRIVTGDAVPIRQVPRRMTPQKREIEKAELDKMLEKDIIHKVHGAHQSCW